MGVGFPLDLLLCVSLGVDMFDCVWPCRTARFGTAILRTGLLPMRRKQKFSTELGPLDSNCNCPVCRCGKEGYYSRAYLASVAGQAEIGCHLLTLHNLYFMKRLMSEARQAILESRYEAYVNDFLKDWFPNGRYPRWVAEGFTAGGLKLEHLVAIDDSVEAVESDE